MLLTDGVHLVSDTSLEELHRFAQGIGLKREWFQGDHYDLTGYIMHSKALRAGAKAVSTRYLTKQRAKQ